MRTAPARLRLRTAVLLWTGIAALTATLVAWTLAAPAPQPAAAPAAAAPAATEPPPPTAGAPDARTLQTPRPAPGAWGAPAGSTLRHRYTEHTEFGLWPQDGGERQTASVHTSCELATTVLARRAGEILVRSEILDPAFRAAPGAAPLADGRSQRLVAGCAAPVLLRLGDDGRVLGYGFAAGLDGEQRNFLRGLLATFAFTVPLEPPARWTAHEADASGEYEASYRREACAPPDLALTREKQRYLVLGAEATAPAHAVRGATTAEFDGRLGWLRHARMDESLSADLPLGALRADTRRRAELTLVEHGQIQVPADVDRLWNTVSAPAAGQAEPAGTGAAEDEQRLWQQRLAGADLQQVLAEIQQACTAEPFDPAALEVAFQRLQWLLRLDGTAVAALAQQLTTGALGGNVAATALGALGAAGTPAAQQALSAVRENATLPADVREAATVAMLQLAEPQPELMASLLRDASARGDGGLGALLVLGALAPRSAAPLADGRGALDALFALERDASSPGELAAWLHAAGNAATPATRAAAVRHLDHPDPTVRAAACTALRRVADGVGPLLQRGLGDADAGVRAEAVRSLGRRGEPEAAAAVRRTATTDGDAEVRREAARALARRGTAADREVLAQMAAGDPDPGVREVARRLLRGE